ncbi:MAG: indole-3-glycerol phosphate synthase [Cyclobacteriaceae bacterium]|jgi:indole-3-glycerol phosphate synthase
MSILEKIIASKYKEVADRKSLTPIRRLEQSVYFETPCMSLKQYIQRPDKIGLIAEIKRKSPSKGVINPNVDIERVSIGYMQAGASGLSVLTDTKFFGGKNEDLTIARNYNYCPILRKDFIIDEYQIVEAKSIGADVILLIAAALEPQQIASLAAFAHAQGMEVLLEIHNESELQKSSLTDVDLVGVNNRDLSTFVTDTNVSKQLASLIPDEFVKVSESGINDPNTVLDLMDHGYKGFLIGESFMQHSRPEVACRDFVNKVKKGLKK